MSEKMIEKKSTKKKKIVLIILAAIVLLGAYRVISSKMQETDTADSDVINIKVSTAELTTLENTSPLTGRLKPVEEVSLMPKVPGEVIAVNVSLGDRVSAGTVLFQMDKAQMASTYKQAQTSFNDAKTNLDRMTVLYNEGAVSLVQFEQARTQYEMAKESFTAASDGMSNYTVTSPINGYVTSVNIDKGSIASQAMPAVTVANIDKLEIEANISENIINKIHVDDKVQVLVKSVSDEPFQGTVTAMSPAPAVGSLTYPIKVTLDNKDSFVKPGMFAEVIITMDKFENVLTVPSNAIVIKAGKTIVATVGKNNKVKLNEVTVGIDNGERAEIKSGLKAGDRIVVEGQYYLKESSKINIIE